jgi:RNA methyltransferase, TrmH family
MLLDSPQNSRIQLARSLHTAKGRREASLFLAEGPSVVEEALRHHAPIAGIAWCEALSSPRVAEVLERALSAGVEIAECTERAFRALSDTQSPQGIAAIVEVAPAPLSRLEGPDASTRFLALVLHDLRDPGNLGTMIRTADAFAAQAVILTGNCADPHEPKVVRATAGSLFHLPVVEAQWPQFRSWARDAGITLLATDLAAAQRLGDEAYPSRLAIVIGNESHGLPPDVLREADRTVRIATPGPAESLNASAAAAILLYQSRVAASLRDAESAASRSDAATRISNGPDGEE